MFEIREFCDRINLAKPNIFKQCKEAGMINYDAQTVEDLVQQERELYEREVRFHYDEYKNNWKDIIQTHIKYQKPFLVNAKMKTLLR